MTLPQLTFIFFRGVAQPPTSFSFLWYFLGNWGLLLWTDQLAGVNEWNSTLKKQGATISPLEIGWSYPWRNCESAVDSRLIHCEGWHHHRGMFTAQPLEFAINIHKHVCEWWWVGKRSLLSWGSPGRGCKFGLKRPEKEEWHTNRIITSKWGKIRFICIHIYTYYVCVCLCVCVCL